MYLPIEMARFALSEFERGLTDLTDEEARIRVAKADGTQMNAISWIVGHISSHWLLLAASARQEGRPSSLRPFASGPSADPTPPPLGDVLKLLEDARAATDWVISADDTLLSRQLGPDSGENLGTALLRAFQHTWFHIGEINAIRQILGHPEIGFVGRMTGILEWRSV